MKKPESILVFDLGNSYIKLLEAKIQNNKPLIESFSVTPVPNKLREIGSINDPSYVDFIKELLSKNKISAQNTVVCISCPQLEIKNLIIPKMSPKELNMSINWQIKDIFSMPVEEAVTDYLVLGDVLPIQTKKMELCVSAIPKKAAGEYVSLLRSLNLIPIAFVLEPLASYSFIKDISDFANKQTVALINMGADKTIISIFENGGLKIMRNLPISGNRLTSSIASKVRTINGEELDIGKAELIKCKYGIPSITTVTEENINPQDIFSALRPSLESLVSELLRFLEYYKNEHQDKKVEIIAVYGGGSKLIGLTDYMSKNIGVPVVLPSLRDQTLVEFKEPEKASELTPFLISTIGAGLIKDTSINLIPQEIKEQKQLRHIKKAWVNIWVGFLISLLAIYPSLDFYRWSKQRTLYKLKIKYEKLLGMRVNLDKYDALAAEVNSKGSLCNRILCDEPFWEDLLKELGSLVPENVLINKITYTSVKEDSQSIQKPPLILEGIVYAKNAGSDENVTGFLKNLENSRYFNKIKLEFSREKEVEGEKVLEFSVGCYVRS